MKVYLIEPTASIIKCPHCGARYIVPELEEGASIRCEACHEVFILDDVEEFSASVE